MITGAVSGHQMILRMLAGEIMLSCTCLRYRGGGGTHGHAGRPGYGMIDARRLFPASEAVSAWRGFHGWST